jgi:SPW repeat
MLARNYATQARTASGMNILLGIWLLVSPWVFGYQAAGSAAMWNSVIVGALIAILGASNCFSQRIHTSPNWINVLLALWTMISPLVYGYTANTGGLGDNVILAILIAAFAVCSDGAATAGEKRPPPSAPAH